MTERDEMLRRALEFYADPLRYQGPNQRPIPDDIYAKPDDAYRRDVTRDNGEIAREALRSAARTGADVAAFEAALAAYNDVWNIWNDLSASNVNECREAALRAAIAALPAPAGESVTVWQPIETAPKDTKIWAWGANWHWQEGNIGFLHSDYNGHSDVVCLGGRAGPPFSIGSEKAPTHWQPLPEPPTRKSEARS